MTPYQFVLKALHKFYCLFFLHEAPRHLCGITDADEASKVIYNILMDGKPCMIARYGSVELLCFCNTLSIRSKIHNPIKFISDKQFQWWRNKLNNEQMMNNAGFFPNTEDNIFRFGELMTVCSKQLDVLGIWRPEEKFISHLWPKDIKLVNLICLEPYWAKKPWSKALEGKRVLVIHPFAEQIEKQYKTNRTKLFDNPDVLPQFTLLTIKAVQSLGGKDNGFKDWFEALQWMEDEMDKTDYDIALIGCGAYGMPLAAHAKTTGHKAVHIGGALQLLFGIKGKRWEDPNYGINELGKTGCYPSLMNEYWIRPGDVGKSKNAEKVENGCYW